MKALTYEKWLKLNYNTDDDFEWECERCDGYGYFVNSNVKCPNCEGFCNLKGFEYEKQVKIDKEHWHKFNRLEAK